MISLDIVEAPAYGKLSVKFSFQFKDTPPKESPVRYGTLAVLSNVDEARGGAGRAWGGGIRMPRPVATRDSHA